MWILLGWLVCGLTCQAGFDENVLLHWGHWVKAGVVETYPLRGKTLSQSRLRHNLEAAEPFLNGLRNFDQLLRDAAYSLNPEQLGVVMRSTISLDSAFLLSDLLQAERLPFTDIETAGRLKFLGDCVKGFEAAYPEHPGILQDIILVALWEQNQGTLSLQQYMRGLDSFLTDEGIKMMHAKQMPHLGEPTNAHGRIAALIPERILLAADLIPLETYLKGKPVDAFHLLLELGAKEPRVKHPNLLRSDGFYVAESPGDVPIFVNDTLETTIRNLFLMALFQSEERDIRIEKLQTLPLELEVDTHPSILAFFKTFPRLKDQYTLKARTQWARALGSFPDLRYQVVLHQEKLGLEASIQNFETLLSHVAVPTVGFGSSSKNSYFDASPMSHTQDLLDSLSEGALTWQLTNTSSADQPRLQLDFTQKERTFQSLEFKGIHASLKTEALALHGTLSQLGTALLKEPQTKAAILGLNFKEHRSIIQEDNLIFLQKWMQEETTIEDLSNELSFFAQKYRHFHPDWLRLFFQQWKEHIYSQNLGPLEVLASLKKTVPVLKATKGVTSLSRDIFSDWMEIAEISPYIAGTAISDLLDASLDVPLFNWIQNTRDWHERFFYIRPLLRSKRAPILITLLMRFPIETLKSIQDKEGNTLAHLLIEEAPDSFITKILEYTNRDTDFWTSENHHGNTPLHLAIERDIPSWSKALIRALPAFARFKKNKEGQNPLHVAVQLGKKIPTALLLENIQPQDLLERQKDGKHLFHLAAERPGHEQFIEFLADSSPLSREEIKKQLLKRDIKRPSPFQLSLRAGGDQAKLLIDLVPRKALKERDFIQNTPAHDIAEHGKDPQVLKQLEAKLNSNIYSDTNIFGDTVLQILARHQENYLAERVYKDGFWIQMERTVLEHRNLFGLSIFDQCLHINSQPQLSSTLLPIISNEHLLTRDVFGFTSLHRVVLARPDLLESISLRLLEEELKPKSSLFEWTPLHLGCFLGRKEDQLAPLIASLSTSSLFEAGFDGNTCLHLSAPHGDAGVAPALLQRMGGNALATQNRGFRLNPLHIALLFTPHSEFTKACVQQAPLKAWMQANILFETPLHLGASLIRDSEVFENMLQKIPDEALYRRNYRLDQPLHSAIRSQNDVAIRLLEKRMRPGTLDKPFLWHPSPRSLAGDKSPLKTQSSLFGRKTINKGFLH